MKRLLLLTMILLASPAIVSGEEGAPAERVPLKDGNTLLVRADGTGRMIDHHGETVRMDDGVEMETEDGRIILMKNRKVWYLYGGSPAAGKSGVWAEKTE